MGGFERLHPHLRHAILHDLGWRALRPVQTMTIDAVLDGANCVVLAPTAGGKTEAAMFPVLSGILSESAEPVSALYVCPIRALLNNQEARLGGYARMVGLDVFKWHGDVSDSKKRGFRSAPCHVLMTTPESLEVMLMSPRTDARALFAGLRTIVIDEVHAFAGDDRGAHLMAVLERLVRLCGRDVQRIGLSATVGNPLLIGEWLQGSSQRGFRLVDPPRAPAERELGVELVAEMGEAAAGIASLARGQKSLVFVESRSKAERVAQALAGRGVEVFIHHSAVSRTDRALAEAQFASGENTAIVCTSTMELGIDVGDLDLVVQLDAPSSVASFLQRLGRTGRRPGTRARCRFFCLSPESLLQTAALLRLAEAGWVEDVVPPAHAMHVLAHQVMALAQQEGGVSRHRLLPWVQAAYPFSSIREVRLHELVDTMVARDILHEADGLLTLGLAGERIYGRKNFFELYAVFSAPPVLRVVSGREEIGTVQALFVSMHDPAQGPLCFRLAGRAWQVVGVEWSRGVLQVRKADRGRVPTWLGQPGALSEALCQAMLDVLVRPVEAEARWLSPDAAAELEALRSGYDGLLEPGSAPLEDTPDGVQWHTFAGAAINRLLAAGMERETGVRWQAGNLSVRAKEIGLVAARQAVRALPSLDWDALAADTARAMARGPVSKFQPCLPEAAEDRLLSERLLDRPGLLRFLGRVRVDGERPGRSVAGRRLEVAPELVERSATTPATVPSGGPRPAEPTRPVRWVDEVDALGVLVAALAEADRVGLDVETSVEFGTLCLIQLALPDATWIVDPLAFPSLRALAPVLAAERPLKIIHYAAFERRVLATAGLALGTVFDTCTASRRRHGADADGGHSLASVCRRELGLELDKSEQTSTWSRRPLRPEQLRYAALDAEVLLALHDRLSVDGDA